MAGANTHTDIDTYKLRYSQIFGPDSGISSHSFGRSYWEQRNRNDILYTNERRTAILEGRAAGSAGEENDTDDDNLIHNIQARKTFRE